MKRKITTSDIRLSIDLDENRIPEAIRWQAEKKDPEQAKAMLLSIWDANARETLKIDLWTKDMPIDDMKQFFHQTLLSLSNTYLKATNDEKMALTMKEFCDYFAEETQLKKRE